MRVNNFHTRTAVVVDNFMYCSNINMNGLFCINLMNMRLEFLGFFPDEDIAVDALHRDSEILGEMIVFSPEKGKNISLYNYKTKEFKIIRIGNERNCAYNEYKLNNDIWFLPFNLDFPVYKLSKNLSFKNFSSNFSGVRKELLRGICNADRIISVVCGTGLLYVFDTKKEEGYVYDTGLSDLYGICKGNNGFWLLPMYGMNLYEMDFGMNLLKIVHYGDEEGGIRCAENIIECDDYIWILPGYSYDKIVKYNKITMSSNDIDLPEDIKYLTDIRTRFSPVVEYGHGYYILPLNANYIFKIEKDNIIGRKINDLTYRDFSVLMKIYKDKILEKRFIIEDVDLSLREFVDSSI